MVTYTVHTVCNSTIIQLYTCSFISLESNRRAVPVGQKNVSEFIHKENSENTICVYDYKIGCFLPMGVMLPLTV